MTTAWPADLPQRPLADDFRRVPGDPVQRTEMDAGRAKVRRRYTAAIDRLTVSFRLTPAQYASLRAFVTQTIQHGTLPFSWTAPDTGAAATFRIVGQPTYTPRSRGVAWQATMTLEQLP